MPESDRPAVEARGLGKSFGSHAVVDGVDLTVPRGECFGLLGPNGAGKTTTLRMILGLSPPDRGSLYVLGEPVPARARAARERIGVVPQLDNLDPDFTVRENLLTYGSYFRNLAHEGRAAMEARVDRLLAFASLTGRADAAIPALSGGMKRRLTLARALINDPDLVVLDEPSTGLDPQARQHIWQRLRDLREDGRTLILTTHYMDEAERLCDRIGIVDGGRLVACDSPSKLIHEHLEPHVIELRGDAAGQWRSADRAPVDGRIREVGETVLLYGHNPETLLAPVRALGVAYLQRPANLEDVFLHLTGHDLRE